jgi:hypothetical protein
VIASAAWSLAFTAAAAIAPEVFMGVLGAIWALALAACVALGFVAVRLDRPRLLSEVSSTTAIPKIRSKQSRCRGEPRKISGRHGPVLEPLTGGANSME